MQLGNYTLTIVGGEERLINGATYVNMRHGQTYKLSLRNMNNKRCNAEVTVDGKHVGTWRLRAFDSATLERPAEDTGLFTFYRLGTSDASIAQIADNNNTGLIQVVFTPELIEKPKPVYRDGSPPSLGIGEQQVSYRGVTRSAHAGGTGLSGQSNQQFGTAGYMPLDHASKITLSLRLMEFEPVNLGPRPLNASPVPPRLV